MKRRGAFGLGMVVFLVALLPASGAVGSASLPRFRGFGTSFELQGTNGYAIWVTAYLRRRDGKGWISIAAGGKHGAAI